MNHLAYNAGLDAFTNEFLKGELEFAGKHVRAAGGQRAPEGKDWWLKNGPGMVFAYHAWRRNNPNLTIWHTDEGVPGIELEVFVNIGDDTIIKGYIDRVFQDANSGELLIVDLKTGKRNPGPLQLAVYRLVLQQQYGISPRYGAYWMARQGVLAETHDLEHLNPAVVSKWLKDTKKAIDLGFLTPHLGEHCDRMCSVNQHCFAYNPRVAPPDFMIDSNLTVGKGSE